MFSEVGVKGRFGVKCQGSKLFEYSHVWYQMKALEKASNTTELIFFIWLSRSEISALNEKYKLSSLPERILMTDTKKRDTTINNYVNYGMEET